MIKKIVLLSFGLIIPLFGMRSGAPTTPERITNSRRTAQNRLQQMTTAVTDDQFYNLADQVRAQIDYLRSVNRPQFANEIEVKLLSLIQTRRARRAPPAPAPQPAPPRPGERPAPSPVPSPAETYEKEQLRRQLKECQDHLANLDTQLKQEQADNAQLREQLTQRRTQEGANNDLVQENKRLRERLQKCLDEQHQLRIQKEEDIKRIGETAGKRYFDCEARLAAIKDAYEPLKRLVLGEFADQLNGLLSDISVTFPSDVVNYDEFLQTSPQQFKLYQAGINRARKSENSLMALYNQMEALIQDINNKFFPRS